MTIHVPFESVDEGRPLRILQVCPKSPWPRRDGFALAAEAVALGLLESGCDLRVVALETNKHPFDAGAVPEAVSASTGIRAHFVNSDVRPLQAIRGLLGDGCYLVERFDGENMRQGLRDALTETHFDFIILESVFMGPYISLIRELTDAPIILRAHNVEHQLWERRAARSRIALKRRVLERFAEQLDAYEAQVVGDVDAVLPITDEDGADLAAMVDKTVPMETLPFSVDVTDIEPRPLVAEQSVFHIGSMDWAPNREGVRWFLDEVWPLVRAGSPEATFHIAGRKLARNDSAFSGPGVVVHGEVDDAREFMAAHRVMIVPLLAAGGMRTKLVEAMAMARPIVSTHIGAEGTGLEHGHDARIADNPAAFAGHVSALLEDDTAARATMDAALRRAPNFERRRVTQKLLGFLQKLRPSAPGLMESDTNPAWRGDADRNVQE